MASNEDPHNYMQVFNQEEAAQIIGWAEILYADLQKNTPDNEGLDLSGMMILLREKLRPLFYGNGNGLWGFRNIRLAACYREVLSRCVKREIETVLVHDGEVKGCNKSIQILLPPLKSGESSGPSDEV